MQTLTMKKILTGIFITFFGMLMSVDKTSTNSINISFTSAHAAVGKPLSAGSVAGVNRRHDRRDAAATANTTKKAK